MRTLYITRAEGFNPNAPEYDIRITDTDTFPDPASDTYLCMIPDAVPYGITTMVNSLADGLGCRVAVPLILGGQEL